MRPGSPGWAASGHRAAMSRATCGKEAADSDIDINLSVPLDDGIFGEAEPLIADMRPVGEVEFVPVPGADDVHVGLVEGLAEIDAAFADLVPHLRDAPTLAGGTTLVRAQIAIGIIVARVPDNANLDVADLHKPHTTVGDLAVSAYPDFRHELPSSMVRSHIIWYLMIASIARDRHGNDR